MALNQVSALDPELLIQMFETDVKKEAVPADVFDFYSSLYPVSEDPPPIQDVIYMKLDAASNKAHSVMVPMIKELSDEPTEGSVNQQLGNEERQREKRFKMEYTDQSHAVAGQEYGIVARDAIPYGKFEQIGPQLGRYFKQLDGRMKRQATLEGIGYNLMQQPTNLTTLFNPNMYLAGLNNNGQPQYTANANTWTQAIAAALVAAGDGTGTYASNEVAPFLSISYLLNLQEWASEFIEPIDLGGKEGYICLIPSPQCTWFRNPANLRSLGDLWVSYSAIPDAEKMFYPDLIGDVGKLRIIDDNRYPTLTLGGTGDHLTMTPRYRGMGRNGVQSDPRDKSRTARQVGALYGRGALCEWMPEPFHYEYHMDNYGKIYGKGMFRSVGIKRVEFDYSAANHAYTANAGTLQNDGSISLIFAAPPNWSGRPSVLNQ